MNVDSMDRVRDLSGLFSATKVAVASVVALWIGLPGALQLLVIMQLLDIVSGVLIAGKDQEFYSKTAWLGIRKKVFAWLLVLAVNALQSQLQFSEIVAGLTPAEVTASYFAIVVEGGSLLENAYRAGLPVPSFVANWLKIAQDRFGGVETIDKGKE